MMIGASPVSVYAHALPDAGRYRGDNLALVITYENGAAATITYVASGDRALGKERVEVHGGGLSAVLQDFRMLEAGTAPGAAASIGCASSRTRDTARNARPSWTH